MQNEFERDIQQQMEQFEVPPKEVVWLKVEAQIRKEKKRRVLFFWLFSAIVLIGASGYYFLQNKDLGHNKPYVSTDNKVGNTDTNIKDAHRSGETRSTTSNLAKPNNTIESLPPINHLNNRNGSNNYPINKSDISKKPEVLNNLSVGRSSKIVIKDDKAFDGKSISKVKEGLVQNKLDIKNDEQLQAEIGKSKTLPKNVGILEASSQTTDSLNVTVLPNKNSSVDTLRPVLNKYKTSNQKKKPWMVGITFSGGISDNVEHLIGVSSAKSLQGNYYSASSSSTMSSGYLYQPLYNFKSSLGAATGVFAQKALNKKFSIRIGINYNYYSTRQSIGARMDSVSTFRDTLLNKSRNVSSFYKPGQNSLFTNSFGYLEFPINILWSLRKQETKPIALSVGIRPGFLLHSKALYYNATKGLYYREKEQLKSIELPMEAGILFTPISSAKLALQVGPTFQYNLINLTKPIIQTKEHLLFFGLKTNLIFKNNSSKN